MDNILHRLRHLLIYKCKMESKSVGLLLGPLIHWTNNHKEYPVPAKAVAMAKKISRVGTIHYLVCLRMCCVWQVYLEFATRVPAEFTFPYYTGVVMDIHIPAIRLGKCTTLQEIYTKSAAPEMVPIDRIEHDSSSRIPRKKLERHWTTYACHVDPSVGDRKTVGRAGKSNAKKKRGTPKININTLLPMVTPSTDDFLGDQNPVSLTDMLKKSEPNPNVYRYVPKTLHEGLSKSPSKNPIIVRMVRMFFLGSYHHARVIAPPIFRIKLYHKMTTYDMLDKLENAKFISNQLYQILAEFVIAATRHNAALMEMLRDHHDHHLYETTTFYKSDTMRTKFHPSPYVFKRPNKVKAEVRRPSAVRLFWELVKHFDIKQKCQTKKIAIAIQGIGYKRLYAAFAKQPKRLQLYRVILEMIDFPPKDLKLLDDLFNESNDQISRHMKRVVMRELSPVGNARLYLYVHYIRTRNMLAYVPIGHKKDLKKDDIPRMLVCTYCFTIRSQCLLDRLPKKAKSGVEIDIINDEARCSSCGMNKIESVDMRRTYVYGPSISDINKSMMHCACSRCGIMTVYKHVIGQSEFCSVCYKTVMANALSIRKCICGAILEEKKKHKSINAINARGQVSIYGLCPAHHYLQGCARPSDIQPLDFYKSIMRLDGTTHEGRKRKRTLAS